MWKCEKKNKKINEKGEKYPVKIDELCEKSHIVK